MAKKIICNLPNRTRDPETGKEITPEHPDCIGVLLHQISPRMVQIGRGNQKISIYGSNWSSMVTCPVCKREHTIVCTSGVISEEGHKYEEIEEKPGGNPADPNDPNNPGQAAPRQVETSPADPLPINPPAPAPGGAA